MANIWGMASSEGPPSRQPLPPVDVSSTAPGYRTIFAAGVVAGLAFLLGLLDYLCNIEMGAEMRWFPLAFLVGLAIGSKGLVLLARRSPFRLHRLLSGLTLALVIAEMVVLVADIFGHLSPRRDERMMVELAILSAITLTFTLASSWFCRKARLVGPWLWVAIAAMIAFATAFLSLPLVDSGRTPLPAWLRPLFECGIPLTVICLALASCLFVIASFTTAAAARRSAPRPPEGEPVGAGAPGESIPGKDPS